MPDALRLAARPKPLFRLAAGMMALAFLSAPSFSTTLARVDITRQAEARVLANPLASQLADFTVQGDALLEEDVGSAQQRNAEIPLATALAGTMKPFRHIVSSSPSYGTAVDCLTEAIYYEAANESAAGKRGVAQVILNRVSHPDYPSSVCGVVYQGFSDPVCQFSYTCDGSLSRRPLAHLWEASRDVARAALAGHVEARVGTATHYHADYVLPYWAFTLEKVHVEGRHIFYRLPGRAGRSGNFTARWLGREHKPRYNPARFLDSGDDVPAAADLVDAATQKVRDPTDRRAENDVGGRLDTSKGWTLSIPDPTTAGSGYRAALEGQRAQPAANSAAEGQP